jgi:MarR family
MTPSQIASLTGLATGSVTALLDRLERGDYVRRRQPPDMAYCLLPTPSFAKIVDKNLRHFTVHESARHTAKGPVKGGGAGGARTHDRRIMRRPDSIDFGFYLRPRSQPTRPELLHEAAIDHTSHPL